MKLKALKAVLMIAAGFAMSSSANAAVYLLSFSVSTGNFSGTITTTDVAVGGFYTITGLTGTKGGNNVTLIAPNVFGGNDNLIKLTPDYVDVNGFSFSAGGVSYNVYRGNATQDLRECASNQGFSCGATLTEPLVSNFSITAAGVPEPATWAMLMVGFAAVGGMMRSRKKATTVRFA